VQLSAEFRRKSEESEKEDFECDGGLFDLLITLTGGMISVDKQYYLVFAI